MKRVLAVKTQFPITAQTQLDFPARSETLVKRQVVSWLYLPGGNSSQNSGPRREALFSLQICPISGTHAKNNVRRA